MLIISKSAAAAAVDAITAKVEQGGGTALLRIYSGTRPATLDGAIAGTKLLEYQLPGNLFPAASEVTGGAVSSFQGPLVANALATGVARWFIIMARDGTPVMSGDCGLVGSNAECHMQDLNVTANNPIYVRSLTAFHPE